MTWQALLVGAALALCSAVESRGQQEPAPVQSTMFLTSAAHAYGELTPDQPRAARSFMVDVASEVSFSITSRLPVAVEITLPDGSRITNETAAGMGVEFQQFELSDESGNPAYHTLVILPEPAEGSYSVQLTASALLDGENGDFSISMVPESEMRFGVTVPESEVVAGRPVVIAAFLFDGTTAVTNASATAAVALDGMSQPPWTVALVDDGACPPPTGCPSGGSGDTEVGDGLYSGVFIPEVPGHYVVVARAERAAGDGTAFERQASVEFRVRDANPATRLRGDFIFTNTSARDDDGDGLIDVLVIRPGVVVGAAGTFDVTAVLQAPNGAQIASNELKDRSGAGEYVAAIPFSAAEIRNLGSDGPFTVVAARIEELTESGSVLHDEVTGSLFSTPAYGRDAFDRPGIVVSGETLGSDPVDADADGSFDALRVAVDVDLVFAGNYMISANLTGDQQRTVATTMLTLSLAAGRTTVELTFDGCEIRRSGLQGPYFLGPMSIFKEKKHPQEPPLTVRLRRPLDLSYLQFDCPDVCGGDCNGDESVTVDELVQAVAIALGTWPLRKCEAADFNLDQRTTVDELIVEIDNAVNGCNSSIGGGSVHVSPSAPATTPATVRLSLNSSSAMPGDTVSVVVTLKDDAEIAAGAQLDVIYDSAVLSPEDCGIYPLSGRPHTLRTARPVQPVGPFGKDRLRLLLLDEALSGNVLGEGVLLGCAFRVGAAAPLGTWPLTAHEPTVTDALGNPLEVVTVDGSVTVLDSDACTGDCNDDGNVTNAEFSTALDVLFERSPISDCPRADHDGDRKVSTDELVQTANRVREGCSAAAPAGPADGPLVTLRIESTAGYAGSRVTLPVSFSGGDGVLSALQVDLVFDAGVLSGPSCSLDPRHEAHTVTTSLDDNAPPGKKRLRVLVLDQESSSPLPDGSLMTCSFDIPATAPPGVYEVVGADERLSDGHGNQLATWSVESGSVNVSPQALVLRNHTLAGAILPVGAGLQDGYHYVQVATKPASPVTVNVTSLTPELCLVGPSATVAGTTSTTVRIPAVNPAHWQWPKTASDYLWVHGIERVVGGCRLQVEATSYLTTSGWVPIVQPGIRLRQLDSTIEVSAPNDGFFVDIGVPSWDGQDVLVQQAARAGGPGFLITAFHENAAVAQLHSPLPPSPGQEVSIRIPPGSDWTNEGGLQFDPLLQGSTRVHCWHPDVLTTARGEVPVTITAPAPSSGGGGC
jgi:hypothetical protein